MRSPFLYPSIFKYQDKVGISYNREPVSDDERRPALNKCIQRLEYQVFRFRVYAGSRVVQNQYARIYQQ